ncbi:hypothetical protein ACTQ54_04010 [Fundicoccus sp. Sow4_H7]|uniref:hypothetical protein n=1 Tax=Fundicoccus sp. Sow4_H7 TaxID=3438784 RepID=UPI003F9187D9
MPNHILFYSSVCPDTPAFIDELNRLNINYDSVNINESISNLKQFLNLRDNRSEFDEIKASNRVGVPVLQTTNDRLIFDLALLESQAQ